MVLLTALAAFVGVGTGLAGMPVASSAAPPAPGVTPVTALVAAPGPQPVRDFVLTARPGLVDGHPVETFDGTVPGPELRVVQGDRVRVTLVNRLPVATTLHWHGVRVPNAEDGVAGLTQDAVAPGALFTYEFVAADAGTYWYHSHQDTGNQIAAGLFGALIVEPPGGHTAETEDRTVLLHDATDGSNTVALNGSTGDVHLDARPGRTVRLRVIDAVVPGMDGTAQAPVLLGAPYRVAALDGHDLHGGQQLGPQRVELGMGRRADLVFTMPASGEVRLVDSAVAGSPSALQGAFGSPAAPTASLTLGTGPPPPSVDPVSLPLFDALSYGTPAPDPTAGPPDLTAPVVLGEHPGFHDGAIQLVHTINQAAAPLTPPIVVRAGQLVRLQFVNTTDEIDPMHLHGHVFSVLDVDGRRVGGSPVHLDTVLVGPRQTVDVAFRADNPGSVDVALPRPAARCDGHEHDRRLRRDRHAVHHGQPVRERPRVSTASAGRGRTACAGPGERTTIDAVTCVSPPAAPTVGRRSRWRWRDLVIVALTAGVGMVGVFAETHAARPPSPPAFGGYLLALVAAAMLTGRRGGPPSWPPPGWSRCA